MDSNGNIQRRLKQQKLRRKARRGQIALKRFYKLIRFLTAVLVFFLSYKVLMMHFWYFPSYLYEYHSNERVSIMGNSIVPSYKILNEMKKFPPEKKPIYKINPAEIAARIEKLPPIKRVYVRRFWFPARYSVMVEEVTPALIISPSESAPGVIAFSLEGVTIGREYLPFRFKHNAYKVLSYGTKGDDYEKWDAEKIGEIYKLARLVEVYSGEKVQYLDMRNPHNVFVKTDSVMIRLGETDISVYERIKAIHEILPVIKRFNDPVLYVDLSWKESKYIKMQ